MAITYGMKQTSIKLVDAIEEIDKLGFKFMEYMGHGKYWFKLPQQYATVIHGANSYMSISEIRLFAYREAMKRQGLW